MIYRFFSTSINKSRPFISKCKEIYILNKFNNRCAGPKESDNLNYICPLHKLDLNLYEATLFGKSFQIDHIIERNEAEFDNELIEYIDSIDNLQPLCLFCHFQKTTIYNTLKKHRYLINSDIGDLWKFLRGDKYKYLYGKKY